MNDRDGEASGGLRCAFGLCWSHHDGGAVLLWWVAHTRVTRVYRPSQRETSKFRNSQCRVHTCAYVLFTWAIYPYEQACSLAAQCNDALCHRIIRYRCLYRTLAYHRLRFKLKTPTHAARLTPYPTVAARAGPRPHTRPPIASARERPPPPASPPSLLLLRHAILATLQRPPRPHHARPRTQLPNRRPVLTISTIIITNNMRTKRVRFQLPPHDPVVASPSPPSSHPHPIVTPISPIGRTSASTHHSQHPSNSSHPTSTLRAHLTAIVVAPGRTARIALSVRPRSTVHAVWLLLQTSRPWLSLAELTRRPRALAPSSHLGIRPRRLTLHASVADVFEPIRPVWMFVTRIPSSLPPPMRVSMSAPTPTPIPISTPIPMLPRERATGRGRVTMTTSAECRSALERRRSRSRPPTQSSAGVPRGSSDRCKRTERLEVDRRRRADRHIRAERATCPDRHDSRTAVHRTSRGPSHAAGQAGCKRRHSSRCPKRGHGSCN